MSVFENLRCNDESMASAKRHLIVGIPVMIVLVAGWRYRWVSDDANIDFRVVQNILHGYGPVFNPGERVEVYTDPLWVAVLAFFSGVFTFISIQWWSVILGLIFTGSGFWLAGLATMSLAHKNGDKEVIPLGLMCVSVVGGVWMFATSGLETGMIFGWLGLSWWLIVRALCHENRGLFVAAAVLSLGFVIRPDMVLVTICDGIALGALLLNNGPRHERPRRRRLFLLVLLLTAIPIASELFRIAYFGLLVSNTALAKSAASSYWHQGFRYAWNFIRPYYLFVPTLFLGAIMVKRLNGWWRFGTRLDLLVIAAPVVGGVLDILYVIEVGGDFMHARMLLPGFFVIFSVCWLGLPISQLSPYPWLSAGVLVWTILCLVSFRYTVPGIGIDMVANERMFYVNASGAAHPIQPSDYPTWSWYVSGQQIRLAASKVPRGRKVMTQGQDSATGPYFNVTSNLPEVYYVDVPNIGVLGLAAGDKVYIFDGLSLANPIGSHIALVSRHRPGHEKFLPSAWLIARFGNPYTQPVPQGASRQELIDAHAALQCQPLAGYLSTITQPLTLSTVIHNFEHAFTWTTMTFSNFPSRARKQLCSNQAISG